MCYMLRPQVPKLAFTHPSHSDSVVVVEGGGGVGIGGHPCLLFEEEKEACQET